MSVARLPPELLVDILGLATATGTIAQRRDTHLAVQRVSRLWRDCAHVDGSLAVAGTSHLAATLQELAKASTAQSGVPPRGSGRAIRRLSVELLALDELQKRPAADALIFHLARVPNLHSLELITRLGLGGGASGTEWVPKRVVEAVAGLTELRELEWGDEEGRVITLFDTGALVK